MIAPDGTRSRGDGYSPEEEAILQRAAKELKVKRNRVFLHDWGPPESKTDVWNVMVGCNSGPGTDTTDAVWVYFRRSYREAIETIARRESIWDKPWQEHLWEDVYLPWEPTEAWFLNASPQDAWAACPKGTDLLWVGARTLPTHASEGLKKATVECASRAFYVLKNKPWEPGGTMLRYQDAVAYLHAMTTGEDMTKENLRAMLSQLAGRVEQEDTYIPEKAIREWHFLRAVIAAGKTMTGMHERAHEAGYHLTALLGMSALNHHKVACIVRHYMKTQEFVR